MNHFDYTINYDFPYELEDRAWVIAGLLTFLSKFKIAIHDVKFRQNHVGDIDLAIHYKYSLRHRSPENV
jgi:hypothetical protein